jgi:3-hydroxyisobutyrate dehydrogenase-like beta-hydroxyacid dehydrogenase
MKMKVGIIGLGNMGSKMTARLMKEGMVILDMDALVLVYDDFMRKHGGS